MHDQQMDPLGRTVTKDEQELLALFRQLERLSQRTDLPPCALMNVKQAMVLMWNACNDLFLISEDPRGD
ncbi:hypothetical protein LBMAG49_26380 [Planctomycetota bacterium]|nr:hypothetical protein [Planctomycetota bacterium]MSR39511.1 hypothetical protein [Planctomycetota bacterium]GDY03309.1 hypothetical protein LBMAG49_26380 [Planctomycetota bacterium]